MHNYKKRGSERLYGSLLLSMLLFRWCATSFRGRGHTTFGASMWFLSQWGNTDQVWQRVKAGVVKSSSKKRLYSTKRNKVSLWELPAQAVSFFQIWGLLSFFMQMSKMSITLHLDFYHSRAVWGAKRLLEIENKIIVVIMQECETPWHKWAFC